MNPPAHSPNSRLSLQEALMDMVKSLTIQLAFLILGSFVTRVDFSSKRLGKLQQDALSVDDALNLLHGLRSLAPPYLHCVVDGVQDLEDRDDLQQTRNFSYLLNTLVTMHENNAAATSGEDLGKVSEQAEEVQPLSQTTTLCFTTDGFVDTLAQFVEQDRLDKVEYLGEAGEPVGEEGIRLMPEWGDVISF